MRFTLNLMGLLFTLLSFSLKSADWSLTEIHHAVGKLDTPSFAGSGSSNTVITTFQHASAWEYGDNFFFVDYVRDDKLDGFNDDEFYGEAYLNISLRKTIDFNSLGLLSDIGIVNGLNASADANTLKYLPGIRLAWDIPGFSFFNTDFFAYLDRSEGVAQNGAPKESDSYLIDFNWLYPLAVGKQDFSIEGHLEFAKSRTNEFGERVSDWVLFQPQIRWDAGESILGKTGKFYLGVELQFWMNKLGDSKTDESALQLLFVWKL